VSNSNGNLNSLFGIPVYGFDDIKANLDDDAVIYIAVADQTISEIASFLKKNGITNYVAVGQEEKKEIINEIKHCFEDMPIQKNKIIIECHNGTSYCCNSKYIVERLHEMKAGIDVVWSVQDAPRQGFPDYVRQVEKCSVEYFREFYTARMLISNAGVPFNGKREGQYHLDTWHGIGPLKKCGYDAKTEITDTIYLQAMEKSPDAYLAGSEFNVGFYGTAYHYNGEVLRFGFPRNDIFFKDNREIALRVRKRYGISSEKKIVLYAPTFRGGKSLDSFEHYDIDFDRLLKSLNKRFSADFVVFGRYHHFLQNFMESKKWSGNIINVSDYQDTQELLVAADVLISDYSSIMWDFSLQYKPVFLYHNDENEYLDDRGFYCPLAELPYPTGHNNDELCSKVETFDEEKYGERLTGFFEKYGALDKGDATEKTVAHILKILQN
jgi:CDP-glycerol glycerophosphotransferase